MLESKKMLGEGAKNLLGEKLGTGRLLQRGASFVEKEQSDTGPGAVALGLLVGIVGWTEGGLPVWLQMCPPVLGREKKLESSPVFLCILHFALKTTNELL